MTNYTMVQAHKAVATSLLFCALSAMSAGAQQNAPAQRSSESLEFTAATLNVHYIYERVAAEAGGSSERPEIRDWRHRRDAVVAAVAEADPDIMGFQEMETFARSEWNRENRQRAYLAEHFPAYAWGATGEPPAFPNTQPIIYRAERFREIDKGFFFFSDDPDRPYSEPWRGRFSAYASWTLLELRMAGEATAARNTNAGGPLLYVFNVHFDARHGENRRRAARLVLERIESRDHSGAPVILLGDFNAPRFFPPVQLFRRNGFSVSRAGGATYHFNRGMDIMPAIDHVLVSGDVEISSTKVDRARRNGAWPSDHYPLRTRVEWDIAAGRRHHYIGEEGENQ